MTKKTAEKPVKAVSALDVLLKNSQQSEAGVRSLSDQFGSVMSLARADVAQLMKQNPGMHITEARRLHDRAQAMSAVIARQFREQRLTASVRQANRPPTGIKGLVDGPTYIDMFNPDWANHCPPDAIEATTSPVAYLADLYRYVKQLEATGKEGEVIPLDTRRPDLKDLVLDHAALNRVEPTIVLVNEILEKSIRTHLDDLGQEEKSVDDVLLEARYPNALPFERYTSQINYVLGRKERSLGDVVRAADPAYPYFKEPGVHSLLSDIALTQDTGLGPVQQGLLLEAPYFPGTAEVVHPLKTTQWRIDARTRLMTAVHQADEQPTTFFQDNFGVGSSLELEDTQTFCLRTGLNTEELEALLSVGAFAPSRSLNVVGGDTADGSLSGSVYINAGQSPAMSIETLPAEYEDDVTVTGPRHRLIDTSADRFDRMNRMIRLARWLDLPFDEVDLLLVASMQAEQNAQALIRRSRAGADSPYLITQNTLRSLGLFQIVRKRFDISAEDFAALLYGLSEFGRGKTLSQFDRVFNAQAMFSIALILDNEPFTVIPQTEAERQKINHLCAALGMTFEVYRFVAKAVEQTHSGEPLRWSREVVSAFYRLVRLPRYLGLSTVEALALLELLDGGGSHFVSKVAGVTQIASYYTSTNTDTLSVIHALIDCSVWLKDNNWTVAQLCQLILPSLTQPVATDAELELLQQLHARLVSALITDSSFAQAGAPEFSEILEAGVGGRQAYSIEAIDWFLELNSYIETGSSQEASGARGLVKYLDGETEEGFETSLSEFVEGLVRRKNLPEALHPKITNMIMRARGAQEALLMEGLAGYLGTSANLAKVLLFWAAGNRYQLLLEVLRVYGNGTAANVSIGDNVLLVLEALTRRAVLANHLNLSPALIAQLVAEPEWFGLADANLSLPLIYSSSQYASILRLSKQGEDTLLDYFGLINVLWESANEADRRLIRDSAAAKLAGYLQWGVREVLAAASHLNPESVIFTHKELDTLARVCLLSRHTGLDANALLALHRLTPTESTDLYRQAAQWALSCLTEPLPGESAGEVGQSVTHVITVNPDYLVANKDGEISTYTLTLRDFMDEPLAGVTITWSAQPESLGHLIDTETVTDENGVSSNRFQSSDAMGTVNVIARFGLGETVRAPTVTIDCDEASLNLVQGTSDVLTALANKLEPINFTVSLVDEYGNKGADRSVEWGATLGEFQRYQTYSDHLGVARSELRSRPAGPSSVVASYKTGDAHAFADVEFVSVPYFQYVKFSGAVMLGVETVVTCSLTELDGTPRVGETVNWRANIGTIESQSDTDAQGIATSTYTANVKGDLTVTVSADVASADKSTAVTKVNAVATIVHQEQSSEHYLVGGANPVVFKVWLEAEGQIAPQTKIEWTLGDRTEVSYSDNNGVATFNFRFEAGHHVVVANVAGTDNSVEFPIVAIQSLEFSVGVEGNIIDPESPDLLSRVADYYLVVNVCDESNQAVAGIEFSLGFTGPNPSLLGLAIEGLGATHQSTLDGVRLKLRADPGLPGSFTLTLTGRLLNGISLTYRLGWIYKYSTATLKRDGQLDLRWVCVLSDLDPYSGDVIEKLSTVEFSIPSEPFSTSLALRLDGRPLYLGIPPGEVGSFKDDSLTAVTRLVALDGYLVALAGTVKLERQ
jgi:hypothetical protein